jgi:quinate dehydrogenase (quinone)
MFQPHPTVAFSGEELPLIPVDKAKQQKDWDNYGNTGWAVRDIAGPEGPGDLQIFHIIAGDLVQRHKAAAPPLQVGNTLYLCTPHNNVIAVEADSGKQIWKREINVTAGTGVEPG